MPFTHPETTTALLQRILRWSDPAPELRRLAKLIEGNSATKVTDTSHPLSIIPVRVQALVMQPD